MLRACLVVAPLALGLVAVAAPEPFPSPIEPAASGKLQCHQPNHEKKTCSSLAGYRAATGGGFENTASVALPTSPLIVMEIVSKVEIRDGQVCGYVRRSDVDGAQFTVGGVEAAADVTTNWRKRAAALYAAMFDHEICTAYVADGQELVTRVSVDGRLAPAMSQRVFWVSPSDGYKVSN